MLTFERIKRFFDNQLWTKEQVYDAVGYGKITAEEYLFITNEPY